MIVCGVNSIAPSTTREAMIPPKPQAEGKKRAKWIRNGERKWKMETEATRRDALRDAPAKLKIRWL